MAREKFIEIIFRTPKELDVQKEENNDEIFFYVCDNSNLG
jgi:hypothetical protein